MSLDRFAKICQSVLPADYERVRRKLPAMQRFLEENLPPPVNRSVTLLTINREEVVIAASGPLVANYLRLHSREIQQQLRETFGLQQTLRFRTIPDTMLQLARTEKLPEPEPVDANSIAALRRNARWIEDEKLRAAMLSLADSLETRADK